MKEKDSRLEPLLWPAYSVRRIIEHNAFFPGQTVYQIFSWVRIKYQNNWYLVTYKSQFVLTSKEMDADHVAIISRVKERFAREIEKWVKVNIIPSTENAFYDTYQGE